MKRNQYSFLLFLVAWCQYWSSDASAKNLIRLEDADAKNTPQRVIIENAFYRAVVDAEHGASIVEFVVKPSEASVILPGGLEQGAGLLVDGFKDAEGGGWWRGRYEVERIEPDRVVLRSTMSGQGPASQVRLVKTLTASLESPLLQVTMEFQMEEGEHRHFPFRYWIRNRLGRPGTNNRYFLPTSGGVETMAFVAEGVAASEQRTVMHPPRPWLAAVDGDGFGLGVTFPLPFPDMFYSYAKNSVATMEWGWDQVILRRGQNWKAAVDLLAFSGLPQVDGVAGGLAAAIVFGDADPAGGEVWLTGTGGECEVVISYCRLPDRTWMPLGSKSITREAGRVAKIPFALPAGASGSYVIRAAVASSGGDPVEFEKLSVLGEPSGRYVVRPLNLRTDQLGATSRAGAIPLAPEQEMRVDKVLPRDSRLVRGFTHAPVDGRTETRNRAGGIAEWGGGSLPAVNYNEFNGSDGLHIELPEGGFNALLVRGGWTGKIYDGYGKLVAPEADLPPFLKVQSNSGVFRHSFPEMVNPRRLSFFQGGGEKSEVLADMSFFQVHPGEGFPSEFAAGAPLRFGGEIAPPDAIHRALESRFTPFYRAHALGAKSADATIRLAKGEFLHLLTEPQDPGRGVAGVSVELDVKEAEPGALLTLRVQDPLDPRRELMGADFRIPGPGKYVVHLNVPDQVFLPPPNEWKVPPRLDGELAPPPVFWLSMASDAPITLAGGTVTMQTVPRGEALAEAGAWRKFLLRGLFSAMSESRPWETFKDKVPVRQQIAEVSGSSTPESVLEVLENAETARLILPDDDIVRQYHGWIYRNIDRYKPLPPPILPERADIPGAPQWAVLLRESWIHVRDIAQWWLDHRLVPGGMFGGGINDDTDLFQTWQCLPMIESSPLGEKLKAAGRDLADSAWKMTLVEGLSKNSKDALHAYEDGANQISTCAWWNYGDPYWFEMAMMSAAGTRRLMVETADGRLHFGPEPYGITEARKGLPATGKDGGFAGKLLMHPVYEVAWYNRNPAAVKIYEQWGNSWAKLQKPGAFVETVDIASGNPVGLTPIPRGPTEHWLALHQLTGNADWLEPIKMGFESEYIGFHAPYGTTSFVLADWDDASRERLKKLFTGGYAGFFLHHDRTMLEEQLNRTLSHYSLYPYMVTEAEPKTDRVSTSLASMVFGCYLGDAPNRNDWVRYNAVSYEGLRGEDFAALVWESTAARLRVAIYNFRDTPLQGVLRTWRLVHGTYTVRTGVDADDDGAINGEAVEREETLQRGARIPLVLAPRKVTVIELTQTKILDDQLARPDLALSSREVQVKDGVVSGIAHNIGAQPAAVVVAVLDASGKILAEKALGNLDAPLDLKPRQVAFSLDVPGGPPPGSRVVLDPGGEIREIDKDNNAVALDGAGF